MRACSVILVVIIGGGVVGERVIRGFGLAGEGVVVGQVTWNASHHHGDRSPMCWVVTERHVAPSLETLRVRKHHGVEKAGGVRHVVVPNHEPASAAFRTTWLLRVTRSVSGGIARKAVRRTG